MDVLTETSLKKDYTGTSKRKDTEDTARFPKTKTKKCAAEENKHTLKKKKKRNEEQTAKHSKNIVNFEEVKEDALRDLSQILQAAHLTSNLCAKVCEKRVNKIKDENYISSVEGLLKEFDKVDGVVQILHNNLSAIATVVSSLRANILNPGDDVYEQLTAIDQQHKLL